MAGQVIQINAPNYGKNGHKEASISPVDAFLGRLGLGSQRAFRLSLNTIARIASNGLADAESFDWPNLRYADTVRIRMSVAERYSVRTANFHLSALRGVLKECWRLELIPHSEYQRAIDLKQVRGEDSVSGRALTEQELVTVFRTCQADKSPAGIRDAAMIGVLFGMGLRRSELVSLDVHDYDHKSGTLTVLGKGNSVRLSYAVGFTKELLADWLRIRGEVAGPLFLPINKGGHVGIKRLTGVAIWQMVSKRAAGSGIKHFSPHDLRRTCATHLLERKVDLNIVRQMLGHKHLSTTAIYDRRGESAKVEAARLLVIPLK
jgi:site-specific recombinase XerD